MTRRFNRFLCAALCLALCLSLCCFLPVSASAEFEISKVLTTTSYTPVALMDVSSINANTSTEGCYIDYYAWVSETDGSIVTGKFGTDAVRIEVVLTAYEGFRFSQNCSAYLNNIRADAYVSEDGSTLSYSRVYAPDVWTPSVVKHPGSETVKEGESTSFVSTATYTVGYKWFIVSPDGVNVYDAANIESVYEGATASGYDTERLNLHRVTPEMDGCRVFCQFSGLGDTLANSREASLTVKYEPKPSPTPEPSPSPTPAPTPSPTPAPTPTPAATPVPPEAPHEHSFSDIWKYDDSFHWHECSCGDKLDTDSHSMVWTQTREARRSEPALEEGICTVCGYSTVRTVPYSSSGMFRYIAYAMIALALLAVIIFIVETIKNAQRKRRRRKRRAAKAKAMREAEKHSKSKNRNK